MFKRISFQYKLNIAFVLTIIPLLIVSATIFYFYNVNILRENIEETNIRELELVLKRFDDRLKEMDNKCKTLHASPEFNNLVFSIEKTSENYFDINPTRGSEVKRMLYSVLITDDSISSIYYMSKYYDFVGENTNFYIMKEVDSPDMKEILSGVERFQLGLTTSSYRFFVPPHTLIWTQDQQNVFSVIRPIRDTYRIYGLLEYSTEVDSMMELIGIKEVENMIAFTIVDDDGSILYNTGDYTNSDIVSMIDTKTGDKDTFYPNSNVMICQARSELTNWTFYTSIDTQRYTTAIKQLQQFVIAIFFIATCILFLSMFILSKALTKPLKLLKEDLESVRPNEEIKLTQSQTNNEIAILANGIEDILNKIQRQSAQIEESRNRSVKAHFETLEAQLNPHFLYNTLSVISASSMEGENDKIIKICNELAKLLRYSIGYESKTVTLFDEIENIKSYLYIMKTRYEDLLEFELDLDSDLFSLSVPKLIIQPIVENCFKHGFSNKPPVWKIKICLYKDAYNWLLSVEDNGTGISNDKILKIQAGIEEHKKRLANNSDLTSPGVQGVGIENTALRLYIFLEGKELFEIISQTEKTVIKIGGQMDETIN